MSIKKVLIFGLFLTLGYTSNVYSREEPDLHPVPIQQIERTYFSVHENPGIEQAYLNLINDIFTLIKNNYVDRIDDKEVLESGIRGMISKLDPHSSYMTEEEFRAMQNEMTDSATFSGIGAEVAADDNNTGYVKVVSPIDGSPAQSAGIQSGDLIISVNNVSLKTLSLSDSISKIRGPKGSAAKLEIIRGDKTIIVYVVRGDIHQQVVHSRMLGNNIGYIRLSTFTSHASAKVTEAFGELKKTLGKNKQFTGIVLDLRSNPGGLVTAAVSISDLFVDNGVIVSTRGRFTDEISTDGATSNIIIPLSVPLVVLINEGSASASEIVTGTLQDLHRATVVGVKSYGKGSVQSIIPLPTGGALRLTVAKYYTASGRVIHGVGITPDIISELPEDYKRKSYNEIDLQLQKAIDIIVSGKAKTGL